MVVLRALVLVTLAGCLRAPDRPTGDGTDATTGVCQNAATSAELRASTVTYDDTAQGVALVRAGAWNGRESVLIHHAGPTFDLACPDLVIPLVLGDAYIRAITPMEPGVFAVLAEKPGPQWRVHRIAIATPTLQDVVDTSVQSNATAPGWIAYHPLDHQLLFGAGRATWLVDTTLPFAQTLDTPLDAALTDRHYAAAPLRSTAIGDYRWAFIGGQCNRVAKITKFGATYSIVYGCTAHPDVDSTCTNDFTTCPPRIARGVIPRSNEPPTISLMSMISTGRFDRISDDGTLDFDNLASVPGVDGVLDATVRSPTVPDAVLLMRPLGVADAELTIYAGSPIVVPSAGARPRLEVGEFLATGGIQALVLAENPFEAGVTQSCVDLDGGQPCP